MDSTYNRYTITGEELRFLLIKRTCDVVTLCPKEFEKKMNEMVPFIQAIQGRDFVLCLRQGIHFRLKACVDYDGMYITVDERLRRDFVHNKADNYDTGYRPSDPCLSCGSRRIYKVMDVCGHVSCEGCYASHTSCPICLFGEGKTKPSEKAVWHLHRLDEASSTMLDILSDEKVPDGSDTSEGFSFLTVAKGKLSFKFGWGPMQIDQTIDKVYRVAPMIYTEILDKKLNVLSAGQLQKLGYKIEYTGQTVTIRKGLVTCMQGIIRDESDPKSAYVLRGVEHVVKPKEKSGIIVPESAKYKNSGEMKMANWVMNKFADGVHEIEKADRERDPETFAELLNRQDLDEVEFVRDHVQRIMGSVFSMGELQPEEVENNRRMNEKLSELVKELSAMVGELIDEEEFKVDLEQPVISNFTNIARAVTKLAKHSKMLSYNQATETYNIRASIVCALNCLKNARDAINEYENIRGLESMIMNYDSDTEPQPSGAGNNTGDTVSEINSSLNSSSISFSEILSCNSLITESAALAVLRLHDNKPTSIPTHGFTSEYMVDDKDLRKFRHSEEKSNWIKIVRTNTFILDSGCTEMTVNNLCWLTNYKPFSKPKWLTVANGEIVVTYGTGRLVLPQQDGTIFEWDDCLFTPNLPNLISTVAMNDRGYEVVSKLNGTIVYAPTVNGVRGKPVLIAVRHENAGVRRHIVKAKSQLYKNKQSVTTKYVDLVGFRNDEVHQLLHRRLGHVGNDMLMRTAKFNAVDGLQLKDVQGRLPPCETCHEYEAKANPYKERLM